MARVFLYIVAGLIILVVIGGILIAAFGTQLFTWAVTPPNAFETYDPPPAPDYANPTSWAARPETADEADATPKGLSDNQSTAQADVFFIHPTTYLSRAGWNAPLDDETARDRIDSFVMRYQASAFNGCCKIYAPLYRQATIAAFYQREDGEKALDFAYEDVRRAFRHFLANDNKGRPLILAGHSQGSRHLVQLLEDEVDQSPVRNRLIAAYVIGYPIPMDVFGRKYDNLAPCDTPEQTGCVISWNSFGEDGDPSALRTAIGLQYDGKFETGAGKDVLCTNPLDWSRSEDTVAADQNPGGVALSITSDTLGAPDPGVTGAHCRDGILYVSPTVDDGYDEILMPGRNFHVYDYNLFYVAIRDNAMTRVAAQAGRRPPSP